jgi:hypothetical protein
MIAFDFECSQGHKFEGWFDNLESYEKQNSKKLISCPYCDDTKIRKVLSPVATKTSTALSRLSDERAIDYKKLAKEVVEYINEEFEDMGTDFTNEALKMHYGVAEERNIRGTATESEEKLLKDEGIKFFKFPLLKDTDKDKKKN